MFKKVLIIIFLLVSIYCCVGIYRETESRKYPFAYSYWFKPLFYLDGDLVYDEDFNLEEILQVCSDEYSYSYDYDEDRVFLSLENDYGKIEGSLPYEKIIKEKPPVEYIYIEKTIEMPISNNNPSTANNPNPEEPIKNDPYFTGYHDVSIPLDSDFNSLIALLSKDIRTSVQVHVDYDDVDLGSVGIYSVYYRTELGDFRINVNVY